MAESKTKTSAQKPAAAKSTPAVSRQDDMVIIEVIDPTGAVEAPVTFTKRLDTLAGKTIAQVGNSWEGPRVHPLIKDLLEKLYPTAKIIPHTEMPDYTDPELLVKAVKEKKCDAVIFGNAA